MVDAEITGYARTLQQLFEIWINPEIEKRKAAGTAPSALHMVQVIMEPGRENIVRLNEEVKGVALVRATKAVNAGDPISGSEIANFEAFELTDEDPNAGHITAIAAGDGAWHLSFNFRYNTARIEQLVAVANEFLAAARFSLSENRGHAFIDNLFSAVELMAKAWLIDMPDDKLLNAKTHGTIKARFNKHSQWGRTDRAFVELYNRLAGMREPARYVAEAWTFDATAAAAMMATAEQMQRDLDARRPRRLLNTKPTEKLGG
jgi:hypothetical protein